MGCPQTMRETARRGRTDPARIAGDGCDSAVQGLGEFERDIGESGPDEFEKKPVDLPAGRLQHADLRWDAALPQRSDPLPGDERIRIDGADDHAPGAAGDQGIHAGGGAAMVAARLQRDIKGGSGDILRRVSKRVDLGMVFTATMMKTLADDFPVPDDHGADQRIRADRSFAFPRQREGAAHEPLIARTIVHAVHEILSPMTLIAAFLCRPSS